MSANEPPAEGQSGLSSLWARISAALSALASGEALSALFERLRTPPEKSVGFTIAVIALGAKLAKADGLVTRDAGSAVRRAGRAVSHRHGRRELPPERG